MKINNLPKRRKHKGITILIVAIAIIALLFLDSRYRIVVTEYELYYEQLPQSFDGYRIVQLSDLHMAEYGENNNRLINMVSQQNPDIIVLTGDFINDVDTEGNQITKLEPFLRNLVKIAPCYFISGNHEWASTELSELSHMLSGVNIVYLQNKYVLLERDGETFILAGVEDPNGPADMIKPDSFIEKINEKYSEKFKILLAHRNDWLIKYPNLPVDLIMCGHSHGGVARLPIIGGIFGTGMDFFPEYDAGLFNEGGYDMIVARGLGGEKPMPRFLNNPEIVTVVLRVSNN